MKGSGGTSIALALVSDIRPKFPRCYPDPESGDQDEFRRLVPDETAALRKLKADGTLTAAAWGPPAPSSCSMSPTSPRPPASPPRGT